MYSLHTCTVCIHVQCADMYNVHESTVCMHVPYTRLQHTRAYTRGRHTTEYVVESCRAFALQGHRGVHARAHCTAPIPMHWYSRRIESDARSRKRLKNTEGQLALLSARFPKIAYRNRSANTSHHLKRLYHNEPAHYNTLTIERTQLRDIPEALSQLIRHAQRSVFVSLSRRCIKPPDHASSRNTNPSVIDR